MDAPELHNKVKVSVALLVTAAISLAVGAFTLGGIVTGILGLDEKINAEVGGVRADMEKEDKALKEQIQKVNGRVDRKIDNHEAIYHKKK